jgi:hypothetical protein
MARPCALVLVSDMAIACAIARSPWYSRWWWLALVIWYSPCPMARSSHMVPSRGMAHAKNLVLTQGMDRPAFMVLPLPVGSHACYGTLFEDGSHIQAWFTHLEWLAWLARLFNGALFRFGSRVHFGTVLRRWLARWLAQLDWYSPNGLAYFKPGVGRSPTSGGMKWTWDRKAIG